MPEPRPSRPTLMATATDAAKGAMTTVFEDVVRIPIGLVCLGGGFWEIAYQTKHPPANTVLLIMAACFAFLGLCFLPFIFPIVKQTVILVVPYLPMVGGKRAGDPPASGGTT